jgi:MFS transporter, UMF1 family
MNVENTVISSSTEFLPLRRNSTKSLVSWAIYDWANSAFPAVIQTFVFAAYFVRSVAINPTEGMALWGFALGFAGILVALTGPILGALADQSGNRKRWIGAFTSLCVLSTSLLWFVKPSSEYTTLGLFLLALGIVGSESAMIFYNAMLPELTGPKEIGRWSGWGWGLGYAGGMSCLLLALLAFVNIDNPWFVLDHHSAIHIRATFLLVACWYMLFSLPLFFFTPPTLGTGKKMGMAVRDGLKQIWETMRQIRSYGHIFRFFIAKMFYIDALVTLFAFGGIYAASTFNMTEQNVLIFGILLNVTAGLGAFIFAFFDDRIGGKKMILFSILCLIISVTAVLLVKTQMQFWIAGLILGIFVGPVQASSRSYLARIVPKELRNQMFGFNALSGKATSFLGPMLVGWTTYLTGNQRWGMFTIIIFLVIGGLCMFTIPADKNIESKFSS